MQPIAESFNTTPHQKLKIIIVCGLPGTGKSTLAEKLSVQLGASIFPVDLIISAMIVAGFKRDPPTGLAAHRVVATLADEHLRLNHTVIIDAVSGVDEIKQMWRVLSNKRGAELDIIELSYSDRNLHKARVMARTRNLVGFSELTWEEVEDYRDRYTNWPEPNLALDSGSSLEANLKKAISYLGSK